MSSSASRFPDCTSMNVNSEIALTACLTPFLIVIVSPHADNRPDIIEYQFSLAVDNVQTSSRWQVYLIADTLTRICFQLLGKCL